MSHVQVCNGDLYVIFKEVDNDTLITYKLDNGAEIDFFDDDLVQIILPHFEEQLNRGCLSDLSIDLINTQLIDEKIILSIKIIEDTINITLDCSSISKI